MKLKKLLEFNPYLEEREFYLSEPPRKHIKDIKGSVSVNIKENQEFIDRALHRGLSYDIALREFEVHLGKGTLRACIYFVDGLVNNDMVNEHILTPLMVESEKLKERSFEAVTEILLPQNQLKTTDKMEDAIEAVCYGSCAIFLDGYGKAILAEVIGWDRRAVGEPKTETAVFGPQQAFNETLKTNTSTMRKFIRSSHLVTETILVGKEGKTNCAVLYMDNITNPDLVSEVKRRIESIDVDYIAASCELEQFIEDKSVISLPQVLPTERPDRCAKAIMAGRVVVIADNSPLALIMPTTVFELLESAEDSYLRPPFSMLVKLTRLLGFFLALYLPGFYIAAITYHLTVLPTGMLTTIMEASRKVPFNSITEFIIMVIAFEVVREASVRVPGFLGSSLGIIGPLVIGQAAISANIVSPVMIIVFSISTIGSFAIPNYSMAFSGRILNLIFIALGSLGGFLGLAAGIFVQLMIWHTTKSFGVNMLSPFAPFDELIPESVKSTPIWKKEKRPPYLKTMRPKEQSHISRGWIRRR